MHVLPLDPLRPEGEALERAVAILRGGGLVAFPTETVYGLGAFATDVQAVERIFQVKGRPRTHPLILHVLDLEMARPFVISVGAIAERVAACFWPGPLTLILPRSSAVPDAVTGGGATVALRAPSHPIARALIRGLGAPIAAPSANRYQSISPTLAEHVVASFRGADSGIELLLDGGPAREGIESTVLDLTSVRPRILRLGALAASELRVVVPNLEPTHELSPATLPSGQARPSPGLGARHYAPRARLVVLPDSGSVVREASRLNQEGGRAFAVLRGPTSVPLPAFLATRSRILSRDSAEYGRALFAALHEADRLQSDCIFVERVPATEPWEAISDRMRRASKINET